MQKFRKYGGVAAAMLALVLVAAACGDGDDTSEPAGVTGSINISGSSTVEPVTSQVAFKFNDANPDVEIAVDGPGTSDGFELFCNGETDVQDASRAIDEDEVAACEAGGVTYVELPVALDGLSVIGNPANAIECLSFGDLYALFGPESEGFSSWADANDLAGEVGGTGGFPDADLTIVAPGTESGTFGSFIDLAIGDIAEERGADETLRTDYQSSGDDNVIIDNAAGNENGLGFVGLAYAVNAGDTVKSFQVDGGEGCVDATSETVTDGSYPLSRTLYIYVSKEALASNPAVQPFVDFYVSDEGLASGPEVGYVALSPDQVAATQADWATATGA